MKNRLPILFCVLFSVFSLSAGNKEFAGTTFTISSNVAMPIHVYFDGEELTITSRTYTTYTQVPCLNATIRDANGDLCIKSCSSDYHSSGPNGSYTHYYYNVTGVYSSSSSSSSYSSSIDDDSDVSNSSYSSNSTSSNMGSRLGSAIATQMSYEGGPSGGLQVVAGIGKAWGEHLEFRLKLGASMVGWNLSGLVGKDWINDEEKILWNVGTGIYARDRLEDWYAWDLGFDIKVGQSACVRPSEMTLLFDVNTTHTFGNLQLIGLTAGASIGAAGDKKLHSFAWDARVGLVFYFLQWNWF